MRLSMLACPPHGAFRVLVVDDDADVREFVRSIVATMPNVQATAVASGDNALAAMRDQWFDVVVSDQRMPGMSGVELLRRAAAEAEGIPRVLISGFGDLTLLQEAVNDAHVERFVGKPFTPDDLRRNLEPLLSLRRMRARRA